MRDRRTRIRFFFEERLRKEEKEEGKIDGVVVSCGVLCVLGVFSFRGSHKNTEFCILVEEVCEGKIWRCSLLSPLTRTWFFFFFLRVFSFHPFFLRFWGF